MRCRRALVYWIGGLIRSGELTDLVSVVARMCGVSRARVSEVAALLRRAGKEQQRIIIDGRSVRPPSPPK